MDMYLLSNKGAKGWQEFPFSLPGISKYLQVSRRCIYSCNHMKRESLHLPCIFPWERWSNSGFVNRSLFLDLLFWPWFPLYNSLLFLLWIWLGFFLLGKLFLEWWLIIDVKACNKALIYSLCSHLFYVIATKIHPLAFNFLAMFTSAFVSSPILSFPNTLLDIKDSIQSPELQSILFVQKYWCLSKLIVTLCHLLRLFLWGGKLVSYFNIFICTQKDKVMNECIFRTYSASP